MAGALESSVATARALQEDFAPQHTELKTLTIGIEGFPESALINDFMRSAEETGYKTVLSNASKEPSKNFADLIRNKCHVIISFPDANQPPTGLPLIPVITVASSQSMLHQALASEFDFSSSLTASELLQKVVAVANGELTKCEAKKIGDIVVPRMVRSV